MFRLPAAFNEKDATRSFFSFFPTSYFDDGAALPFSRDAQRRAEAIPRSAARRGYPKCHHGRFQCVGGKNLTEN
jgi:hypothetical protein